MITTPRLGLTTYWLSDDAWNQLVDWKVDGGYRGVAELIDSRYVEWCDRRFVIKDSGLVELWSSRLAQGYGWPLDPVMYAAVYVEWGGRVKRGMNLSQRSALGLGLWAEREGLFRRHPPTSMGVVGLVGLSLEMIGRGWME